MCLYLFFFIACSCFSCNNLCCDDVRELSCAFSSFVRECTDISYVAGEGAELPVHRESVVVEEIKEVELRSRPVQFIYGRNKIILELGYSHAVTQLADFP